MRRIYLLLLTGIMLAEIAGGQCTTPSAVTVGSITTTAASVNFTSTGTSFIVEYGATGFTPGTGASAGAGGTVVTGGASPIALSGLTSATTYDVYVRQVCAGPTYSTNSSVVQFTTLCTAVTTFTENWDGVTAPVFPTCFYKVLNSLGSASTQASSANSPLNTLYIYSSATSDQAVVALRPVSNAGANTNQLRFQARGNFTAGETLQVGYLTDPLDASTFTLLQEFTISSLTYTEYICIPGTAPGSNQVLAFRNKGLFGYSILIDDLSWEALPACPVPASVSVGSITTTSASISFVSGGTSFIVEYGTPGFIPGTGATAGAGTIVTGAASPIALTGLTAGTSYDVYVRRVCTGPTYSTNTAVVSFATACNPVSIPYTENFDAVTPPAIPICSAKQDVNGGTTWITSTTNPRSAPNCLDYPFNTSLPGDDWWFTPGFNLTGGTSYRLTFWYRARNSSFPEGLEIKYGSAQNAAGMTSSAIFSNSSISNTTYAQAVIDFTPASSGLYYIGFHDISLADEFDLHVDDITFDVTPSCASPTGVIVVATGANSAAVSFTSPGTSFLVEYGAPGFTPGTGAIAGAGGTVVAGASSPIALTGMTGGPGYDIYVRRVCAGPTYSSNSSVTAFLANDDAPGARTLTLGAGCTGASETNVGATKSTGEVYPSCSGSAATPVWYKFVAPASGAVRISTDVGTGNTFTDSKIAIFSAQNVNDYTSFSAISCDDDGGSVLGVGFMSVVFATGLSPGTTYYVSVDRYDNIVTPGTFCITADELNSSMIATTNTCSSTTQTPGSNGVTNYTGWVPLLDASSKLVALVKNSAGGDPSGFSFKQNINNAAVRTDVTSGEKYLDRSFFINSTATNADLQLFFLNSELTALAAVDPAATLAKLRVTKQTGASCQGDFVTANGTNTELLQSGSASSTDGLVKWIQVTAPSFSNFYIHSTRAPLIVKTFLQGAYNSGLGRHKDVTPAWAAILNANALNQPYNTAAFGNYNGGESVSPGFFTSDATNARDITDWVLLEVKDATLATVSRRAAFVREDGKIVDINGDTLVTFNGVGTGNFYLTVRHRNHLGISVQNLLPTTAKALGVPPPTSTYDFDFTTATDANIFGDALAYKIVAGNNVMIAGNANSNTQVRYAGLNNDPGSILVFLGGAIGGISSNVYSANDVNLDGTVRYAGLNNDPGFLLSNSLGGAIGLIVNEQKR